MRPSVRENPRDRSDCQLGHERPCAPSPPQPKQAAAAEPECAEWERRAEGKRGERCGGDKLQSYAAVVDTLASDCPSLHYIRQHAAGLPAKRRPDRWMRHKRSRSEACVG